MGFIYCDHCGKKLIERLENGCLKFAYGFNREKYEAVRSQRVAEFGIPDHIPEHSPVEMVIFGSVKMRCINRSCQEWIDIPLFPFGAKDVIEKQSNPKEKFSVKNIKKMEVRK